MPGDEPAIYEAYCPACGETGRAIRTVPWQDDTCVECGGSVEE